MKRTVFAAATLAAVALATGAQAHFQIVYTPDANVQKPGNVPFKLIFWHPFENGHVMDMGQPQSFFVVHRGQRTDLMGSLKPITFQGAENKAKGFELTVPVKENGDYVLALTPAPYWDETENHFIHQIAKVFVNKGGLPTDCHR